MIFWLVLKLGISYFRVMISWRILVSFRGLYLRLYFCMVKYFNLHHSSTPCLSCWDLPIHGTSICALLVISESSHKYGCTDLVWESLELLCGSYWLFFSMKTKSNQIKTGNCIGIWGCSWCCCKALDKSDLIEFNSQYSELRCVEQIDFRVYFVAANSNKLQKNGFGKKNQLSPQCVHILKFFKN